jgi:hypothetical protein
MVTIEASNGTTVAPFAVLNVVLDSGERTPCLVEPPTWVPARIAPRRAVRYRRYQVQSSVGRSSALELWPSSGRAPSRPPGTGEDSLIGR